MAFRRVKGAEDFFPEEKAVQDAVFDNLRSAAKRYGFSEVDIPVLESIDLLTAKSGEDIKQQIFTLEKRSREELGMRFEFTAGLARMFIEKQKELAKPVKWFAIGKVWRYEQPQAGRLREFFQFNPEIYGSKNPEADAEVINLAVNSLCSLGLTKKDFFVKLSNRKLLQGLLLEIAPEDRLSEVLRIIDKKQKITAEEFEKELLEIGLDKAGVKKLNEILGLDMKTIEKYKMNSLAKEGYEELKAVLSLVKQDFVRFDITVARGLAYYTSTVFEAYDSKEKFRALCGGGRYDTMIEVFGGEKTPATGFGMGWSTIALLLKDKGLLKKPDNSPEYYIAVISDSAREQGMKIASGLRERCSVEIDLMRRNLGNQIKYARSLGAKKLIVIGDDEIRSGRAKVKDLSSGEEAERGFREI